MALSFFTFELSSIIKIFFIFFISIFVPYLYIKVVAGIVNRLLIRIINADFSINPTKVISLFFGYVFGTILFAYIIYQLFFSKLSSMDTTNVFPIVSASALSFCFVARIITREQGYMYGKQYTAILGSLASIMFFINVCGAIDSMCFEFDLYNIIKNLYPSAFNHVKEVSIFLKNCAGYILVGSFANSFFGEYLLTMGEPTKRSLPTSLEKFYSNFVSISGKENIYRKMNIMVYRERTQNQSSSQDEIKSIKVISRTLVGFKDISGNINTLLDEKKVDFKIIAPYVFKKDHPVEGIPTEHASELDLDDYYRFLRGKEPGTLAKFLDDYYLSLDPEGQNFLVKFARFFGRIFTNYLNGLNLEINTLGKEKKYENTLSDLNKLEQKGKINWSKQNLENFRILIVNDRELLLIVSSGGISGGKTGLYTEEPYIVKYFVHLFDGYFDPDKVNNNTEIVLNY
ncbi:hypothetical protein ACSAZK_09440 [Methanosarcina sp. Mfa9]|uniref:hypothetical protein n=1 Tax=Methanosarcina sp. Mfa9 TaxID=3439063 RepID=UPI003F87E151